MSDVKLLIDWTPWHAWMPHIDVEIRDLWVGVYWDNKIEGDTQMIDLYICIIPVFPIHLHFERSEL